MGQPELATDARYATHDARGAHQAELDALIGEWTGHRTIDEVDRLMIAHSIPGGRVYTARDMLADEHFAAREAIVTVATQTRGPVPMQNAFPRLSRTPSRIRRAAPAVPGRDNSEVYGRILNIDAGKLADLGRRGII